MLISDEEFIGHVVKLLANYGMEEMK